MRISVLTDLEKEDPRSYDAVVDQVAEALRQRGHEVAILGVYRDLRQLLDGLDAQRPELVFNLLESFGDALYGAVGIVGVLELLGVPYTGGGPGEFYLQPDKALTKKLVA